VTLEAPISDCIDLLRLAAYALLQAIRRLHLAIAQYALWAQARIDWLAAVLLPRPDEAAPHGESRITALILIACALLTGGALLREAGFWRIAR
jgi:hypothetical protein